MSQLNTSTNVIVQSIVNSDVYTTSEIYQRWIKAFTSSQTRAMVGRRPHHATSKLPRLVLSSARSCRSSICPGSLSTAWLVSLVVFSCRMVSKRWHVRSVGLLWGSWFSLPSTILIIMYFCVFSKNNDLFMCTFVVLEVKPNASGAWHTIYFSITKKHVSHFNQCYHGKEWYHIDYSMSILNQWLSTST